MHHSGRAPPLPVRSFQNHRPARSIPVPAIPQQHLPQQQLLVPQIANTNAPLQQRRHSAPPGATFTQEQIDQAWSTYTPEGGRTFYHNTITKSSVYEIPDALRKQQLTAVADSSTSPVPNKPVWKEYLDAKSGKKYYSNGTTTTWEVPPELKVEASSTPAPTYQKAEPDLPPNKKPKLAEHNFGSKEESITAFKGLLLAKEVSPTAKWHEVAKLCQSTLWDACEEALTAGERKQALAEYQTKRANELRALERQERVRAKESFQQLLAETLPTRQGFSVWTSRWEDIRNLLSKDDRFHTVSTEEQRKTLFSDFCEELEKREERRKRNKKKEAEENFISFLKQMASEGKLSYTSSWTSFLSVLSEAERRDSCFLPSPFLSEADREVHFADFVSELQKFEDDKRNRLWGARKRTEKAQREAFVDELKNLAVSGKLLPSSRWETSRSAVEELKSYSLVCGQEHDMPKGIFEQFINSWVESYRRDRDLLSQLIPPKLEITCHTTYDEFTSAILNKARETSSTLFERARQVIDSSEPVSSALIYLKELSGGLENERARIRPYAKVPDSSEDEGEIVEEDDEES